MKKIAIITGASSGIGRQIAIDLSKDNFQCVLLARNLEKLKSVQVECKNSKIYQLDLDDSSSIQSVLNLLISKYSDQKDSHMVLINNAGLVERQSFEDSTLESWRTQFQTNLLGPVELTQGLLAILKKQNSARIINISSTLGIKPIAETSAYSATKAAMNSWTQSLALELAKYKISVNAICPGIIETPLQSFYETKDSELRTSLNKMQPLGRLGQPQDISSLTLFLSQSENNWITGSLFTVDGGILLG